MRQRYFGLFLFLFLSNRIFAAQGIASQGNWNNPSTWLFGGVHRVPACGDTLFIPAGVRVTVTNQLNFSNCTDPFVITVQGTLYFKEGEKLRLPCNSSVVLLAGGKIDNENESGNSSYIRICSCTVWQASVGTIFGPQILNCGTLPITLLSFSAEEANNIITLHWQTGSETNNEYFNIERSVDGINFDAIGKVPGAGNSTQELEYGFSDIKPLHGISYYRLRQTDFDGNTTVSDIVAVNRKNGKSLQLVNCSFDENAILKISLFDTKTESSIRLYDISGKEIFNAKETYPEGFNKLNLQVPNLSVGCYMLMISNGEENIIRKLFVDK